MVSRLTWIVPTILATAMAAIFKLQLSQKTYYSIKMDILSIPATSKPERGAIVLLHGWGANNQDLIELVPYLRMPAYQFWCPNGFFDHEYTATGKMWYSFTGAGDLTDRSRTELATSRQLLTEWILALPETTGIPLSNTWIGGFSQGGAMTLDVGLSLPVGGLFVLSGYLHPDRDRPDTPIPPITIVHGRQDDVVPIEAAHRSHNTLSSWGAKVNYHEIDMGHTIVPEVLQVVKQSIVETATNH
jgi:phospholipase/carboxylesterase